MERIKAVNPETALQGRKILLGVTGGIAAYKSVYLLRLLRTAGADVRVIMTEAACEFISPLTFETLSENKVHVHMFNAPAGEDRTSPVEHIELARWPDLAVIAPTTANSISKFARGGTDDLLSAVISACSCTIVLAPAMNDKMWTSRANEANLAALSNRGFRVVPPGEGELACCTEGEGRMAEPDRILKFIISIYSGDFKGLKVLVSAGRTEEDIDAVRFISNRSSGKMGFALAEAARDRGAEVTVIAGRYSAPCPRGVRMIEVRSASEMSNELKRAFVDSDMLLMAAAVGDFTVKNPEANKHKAKTWALELSRTEDILAALCKKKERRFVIGFALETENTDANAMDKLNAKGCDLIVANNAGEEGAGFGCDTNAVTIFNQGGRILATGIKSKIEIAEIILRTAQDEKAFKNIKIKR